MAVAGIAPRDDIPNGDGGAVVQVGSGAPEFDQRGDIESVCFLVVWTAGTHVALLLVREQARRMALHASGAFEHTPSLLRQHTQLAIYQVRAWDRLQGFQIGVNRARYGFRLLRVQDVFDRKGSR